MNDVRRYIAKELDQDTVDEYLSTEQTLLDTMRGEVELALKAKDQNDAPVTEVNQTILDAFNLEVSYTNNDSVIQKVKKLLGDDKDKFYKVYEVTNKVTEGPFQEFIKKHTAPNLQLFWHGSRNENWWSIMTTGLKVRPANAAITGKMFGYGIYFADKAAKSLNYTSYRGSYFARGTSDKAFMALYDVALGKTWDIKKWDGSYSSLDYKQVMKAGYDSVFAERGADLRNNEYIVYAENQMTIRYLVELK
jgi:poly [ADP-ribose] polymerase